MRYQLVETIIDNKMWYRILDTQRLVKLMNKTERFYVSRTRFSQLGCALNLLHDLNTGTKHGLV